MKWISALDPIAVMEELLTRERGAILAARFSELGGFAAEKQRLSERISQNEKNVLRLRGLTKNLIRNASLMSSMRDGVIAARSRIDALENWPAPLETYDASGQKTVLRVDAEQADQRV